jgi:7,8-dihydropterin-6-yl-methyl-4-(beta-D-ribofuranosyl)aminobenzene 5'-phosphate synthase
MPGRARAAIDRLPLPQITWTAKPVTLTAQIGITGPIPRSTAFEDTGGAFYLDDHGRRPDDITDDQALWIKTADGLIVCVGCSHAGIVNTLAHIRCLSGIDPIRAVIGGFHLINADDRRIENTRAALNAMAPKALAPCHCTGAYAMAALTRRFADRLVRAYAGAVFTF